MRFLEKHKTVLFAAVIWLALILIVGVMSSWFFRSWRGRNPSADSGTFPYIYFLNSGLFPAVFLIIFWILSCTRFKRVIQEFFLPLNETLSWRGWLVCILTSIGLATLPVFFSNSSNWDWLFSSSGALAVTAGTATFLSFYATVVSVRDRGRIIRNFSELLERVCELIEKAGPHDVVKFMACTPALGFLALRRNEWEKLETLLISKARKKIQFTCLQPDDLQVWHRRFIGRKTGASEDGITLAMAEEASNKAREILAQYWQDAVKDKDLTPVEKRIGMLPGYYVFTNNRRAIIVAPFFTQYPLPTPQEIERAETRSVEMLGFETTDASVVTMAKAVIERYRTVVPNKADIFETSPPTRASELGKLFSRYPTNIAETFGSSEHIRHRLECYQEFLQTIQVTPGALARLKEELSLDSRESTIGKLNSISDKTFPSIYEFRDAIEPLLTPDQFLKHLHQILMWATVEPEVGGKEVGGKPETKAAEER